MENQNGILEVKSGWIGNRRKCLLPSLEQWIGCWIIMENPNGILEVKNAYCHQQWMGCWIIMENLGSLKSRIVGLLITEMPITIVGTVDGMLDNHGKSEWDP